MPDRNSGRNGEVGPMTGKAGDPRPRHCRPLPQPLTLYIQSNGDMSSTNDITILHRSHRTRNESSWLKHYACVVFRSNEKMSGRPPIICRIPGCGRGFTRRESLRRHLGRCHPRNPNVNTDATEKAPGFKQLMKADNRTVIVSTVEETQTSSASGSQQAQVNLPRIRAAFTVSSN